MSIKELEKMNPVKVSTYTSSIDNINQYLFEYTDKQIHILNNNKIL